MLQKYRIWQIMYFVYFIFRDFIKYLITAFAVNLAEIKMKYFEPICILCRLEKEAQLDYFIRGPNLFNWCENVYRINTRYLMWHSSISYFNVEDNDFYSIVLKTLILLNYIFKQPDVVTLMISNYSDNQKIVE